MKKRSGLYPPVRVEGNGRAVVSQAGAVLLVETVRKTSLDQAISAALAPWCKPRAVHDPGRILLDVALATALGGDCLADVAILRAEPALFGPVASDPTVSRLVDTLAAAGSRALAAIRAARAEVRDRVWQLAGRDSPHADGQVIVDIDGVLVLAHSDKEDATRTWKKTYGHHPLMAFVDHGRGGTGEPVAGLLRPGRAGSNTAADHIETTRLALAQLPREFRRGRRTLIRTDSAGGSHTFLAWLTARGRWLSYSVGMTITEQIHQAVLKIPASAWMPAVEPGGEIRDGAWVAELAGDVLDGWPKGMRLIVRKERPHPGAQLRFTDADGMRLTAFATNTKNVPIAALELRHRQRARAEDRIRAARATGLRNLPLHDSAQNQVWLEIMQIALELLAWMPMLALTGPARLWEPKRLRLRLFSAAAQLVTTGRRRILRLAARWPWTDVITDALQRLATLPNPG
ncbi:MULTISPECIES: IS1380 family transposase [Streptomyces violaceusniger group]|uniref:IS1380 family transposase n=1 Tax=Streptomyces antimycoticus TaxID=68175 RepID=A0ABD5JRK0_9ACTN|nr:IS1380 family transposase [Streptomyces violaceusniger]MEE4590172.1 IS1380 family transposase [Streptomyces sp. DSM 41602]